MTSQAHYIQNGASGPTEGPALRPLNINFDEFTEGDAEYKKELGLLLIENLREFRQSLTDSIHGNDPGLFKDSCHKAKVTLSMLADGEFTTIVDEMKRGIANADHGIDFQTRIDRFRNVCEMIIMSLKKEIDG